MEYNTKKEIKDFVESHLTGLNVRCNWLWRHGSPTYPGEIFLDWQPGIALDLKERPGLTNEVEVWFFYTDDARTHSRKTFYLRAPVMKWFQAEIRRLYPDNTQRR